MSIQTPLGGFTPTRVLQGSTEEGNHFQSATAQVFMELQESLAKWQDDFLMDAAGEERLLKLIHNSWSFAQGSVLRSMQGRLIFPEGSQVL